VKWMGYHGIELHRPFWESDNLSFLIITYLWSLRYQSNTLNENVLKVKDLSAYNNVTIEIHYCNILTKS
jgi:hypothetical protein